MNPDIKKTDKLVFDLEMLQINYNEQKKNALKKEIAEKYNVPLKNVEINFIPITVDKNGEKISLTEDIIANIQDPVFQKQLLNDYVTLNKIENVNIEDIYAIDDQINTHIDFTKYKKQKSYRFKYVKWDNYLSYGKDNYFDFTTLNGLVLLNGEPENQCGKTTFAIDLLRFVLFGKADKSPTLDSVFNIYRPQETEVMVEACIEIDDNDYVIRRTITRPALNKRTAKSKPKQKVEYFRYIDGNYELIENCEGESNTQTSNIIKEAVGSVEDFNLVISATAFTLADLLRMGQTDKGKLFSRWLGLMSLEEKDKITKEYYKTQVAPSLLSSKYDKKTLSSEIEDFTSVINGNNELIKNEESKKKCCEKNIEDYQKEYTETISKKKEIKDFGGIDVKTVETQVLNNNNELEIKRGQFKILKSEYERLKDSVFNKELYNKKRVELIELQTKNGELKGLIKAQKEEIERINKLKTEKICVNCGHPIDVVEQDKFIENINETINKFIAEGLQNKEKITSTNKEIEDLELQRNNVEKLNKTKLQLSALKVTIENIKLKIENLQKQKQEIEDNRENIAFNNNITNKINIINEKIKVENNIKENCIKTIQDLITTNNNYDNEIKKRNILIEKLTVEETLIKNWTLYQQLVGKNGIIKIILRRALPVINNELTRLLNGLCDFEVVLSISEDNKVCMDLFRDGIKLDLGTGASGFESCISSLALRCALGNIASMPRPNLLVLDEILGGISPANVENIMTLYKRVLCNYDFILHICHDSNLVDYHDKIITVTKQDNVSVIKLK